MVNFKIADASIVAIIEIIGWLDPGLPGRLDEAVEDVPAKPLFFNAPFAAMSVIVGKGFPFCVAGFLPLSSL